jgi:hypothetical protein
MMVLKDLDLKANSRRTMLCMHRCACYCCACLCHTRSRTLQWRQADHEHTKQHIVCFARFKAGLLSSFGRSHSNISTTDMTAMAMPPAPFVNAELMQRYIGHHVRIVGVIVEDRSLELTLRTSDNRTVKVSASNGTWGTSTRCDCSDYYSYCLAGHTITE